MLDWRLLGDGIVNQFSNNIHVIFKSLPLRFCNAVSMALTQSLIATSCLARSLKELRGVTSVQCLAPGLESIANRYWRETISVGNFFCRNYQNCVNRNSKQTRKTLESLGKNMMYRFVRTTWKAMYLLSSFDKIFRSPRFNLWLWWYPNMPHLSNVFLNAWYFSICLFICASTKGLNFCDLFQLSSAE